MACCYSPAFSDHVREDTYICPICSSSTMYAGWHGVHLRWYNECGRGFLEELNDKGKSLHLAFDIETADFCEHCRKERGVKDGFITFVTTRTDGGVPTVVKRPIQDTQILYSLNSFLEVNGKDGIEGMELMDMCELNDIGVLLGLVEDIEEDDFEDDEEEE